MTEQVAHSREALLAQGPKEISSALVDSQDNEISTAYSGWISLPFLCSRFRSVALELDITPDDATSLQILVEVSRDGTLWTPSYFQDSIASSQRLMKPDVYTLAMADLNPAGGSDNRAKLPPIDCRDLHWIRFKIKKTGGTGTVSAQAYATGGQGA